MRRNGLYDGTRGLTTLLAAGLAGLLLWAASQVGVQTVGRFWAAMGIVAAAGLVLALAQVVGGWTKGGRLRVSPTTFVLGFLPVLVCAGWILLATQPGSGWYEGTFANWTSDIGLSGLVHSLGLWHGVLAFGIGLVLGMTLDTVPVDEPVVVPERRDDVVREDVVRDDETLVADDRGPAFRQRPTVAYDADEPTQAEREEAAAAEPPTVTVGPRNTNVQQ